MFAPTMMYLWWGVWFRAWWPNNDGVVHDA